MGPEQAARLLIGEYSRMAEAYDRHVAPHYVRIGARALDLAELGSGESVVDLGCGTGRLAILAAGRVGDLGNVLGVDLAEGMVRCAVRAAGDLGLRSVQFETMDSRALDLEDGSFDVAVSVLSLPTVGFRSALREAARVLRSGGRFVATEWSSGTSPAAKAWRDVFSRYEVGDPPRGLARLREARRVVTGAPDASERRDPDAVIALLRGVGFRHADVRTDTIPSIYQSAEDYLAYLCSWGDNEREFEALEEGPRASLRLDFARAMEPFVTDQGLVVPREVHFFSARK